MEQKTQQMWLKNKRNSTNGPKKLNKYDQKTHTKVPKKLNKDGEQTQQMCHLTDI